MPQARVLNQGDTSEWRLPTQPPDQLAEGVAVSQGYARQQGQEGAEWRLPTQPPDQLAEGVVAAEGMAVSPRAQAVVTAVDPAALALKDADYAEEIGDAEEPARERVAPASVGTLDTQAIYRIIREVALAESADMLYSAVSADAEYTTYQQRHFGLAFGLVLFTQESGRLGSVLRLMQRRDAQTFAEIFGAGADELIAVTNASSPQQRLAPVAGEVIWSPGWVERFRQAGAVPAFQAAQNEEAIEGQFRPCCGWPWAWASAATAPWPWSTTGLWRAGWAAGCAGWSARSTCCERGHSGLPRCACWARAICSPSSARSAACPRPVASTRRRSARCSARCAARISCRCRRWTS